MLYQTHPSVVKGESQWCLQHPWLSDHSEQDECPTMAIEYVPYDGPIVTRAEAKIARLKRYFMGPDRPCGRHGHVSERKTVDGQCIACTRVGAMTEAEIAAKRARTKTWDDAHREQKNAAARELYEQTKATEPDKLKARWTRNYHLNPTRAIGYTRRWQAANAEHIAAYRKANKEKIKTAEAKWAEENSDRLRARRQAWRALNPEKVLRWRKENPEAARAIKLRYRALLAGAEGSHTAAELKALHNAQKGKCAYCREPLAKGYHADHIQPLSKGGSNRISNIQLACGPCNVKKHAADPLDFARRLGRLL